MDRATQRRLIQMGAKAELQELDRRRAELTKLLGTGRVANSAPRKKARREWNPAQRKAAAKRMKAFWAARKKTTNKKAPAAS